MELGVVCLYLNEKEKVSLTNQTQTLTSSRAVTAMKVRTMIVLFDGYSPLVLWSECPRVRSAVSRIQEHITLRVDYI
jgi:hypothetical protein